MKTVYAVLLVLLVPLTARGALVPAEHELFEVDQVQEIRLYFSDPDYWDILESNYSSETYLSASFQWNDHEFDSVGVRLKGGSSYIANRTEKKSFKIDLDVFVDDQNIDGIYKLNLNCNFNDPSFVREAAAYEIAAAAGIPCPRTTFATLYINDTYWGLYTLVEQFDSHFIEERFGSGENGNLWKGDDYGTLEFLGWDQSSYYGLYELKTNESENDWSPLMELCYQLNNTPVSELPDTLSSVMDVNTGLLLLAVDNLLVNLDSYSGRCVNYYAYHADRDDRFVFGEWDMNESWGVYNEWSYSIPELEEFDPYWVNPSMGEYRSLAEALWSVEAYRDIYEGHLLRLLATEANPDVLIPRMEEMRDLIRQWVYMEEEPRRLFSSTEFDNAMDVNVSIAPGRYAPALGTFVENRYSHLTSILGTWVPENELILNELMAVNDSTVADSAGGYDDWIELVNTGDSEISLAGYFLTDDMAFPERYAFPDTTIQPGEYMILWADNEPEQGTLHMNFRLDEDGEEIYLMHGSVVVDWITFPDLDGDESWGRWLDLEDFWAIQAVPTPGAPNSDEEPEEEEEEPEPAALGFFCCNPLYAGTAEVVLSGDTAPAELTIFDMSGRVVATPFQSELSGEQTVSVDTSAMPSGVYIFRLVQAAESVSSLITVIR